jgi:hypothetical protein
LAGWLAGFRGGIFFSFLVFLVFHFKAGFWKAGGTNIMLSKVPSKYITVILAGFLPIPKIGFCLYVMCRLMTSVGLLLSFHPGNWLSPGLGINNLSVDLLIFLKIGI